MTTTMPPPLASWAPDAGAGRRSHDEWRPALLAPCMAAAAAGRRAPSLAPPQVSVMVRELKEIDREAAMDPNTVVIRLDAFSNNPS